MKKYISLFAIAFYTITNINAQSKVDLPVGKQLKVTTVVETSTSSEMGMGNMDMNITTSKNIKVISDKNDKLILAITNDKMNGEVSLMGQTQKLNSEEDNDGLFKELVDNFKDEKMTYYSIDKKSGASEITDVSGTKIVEDIEDMEVSPMQIDGDGANLKMFKILSANVKTGDRFGDTAVLNGLNTISDYVVTQIDAQSAYLDINSKISGTASNEMQGQSMTTNSEGTGKGKLIIDRKSGLSKKFEMEIILNMTMEMGSESIEMKSTTKSSTTIE